MSGRRQSYAAAFGRALKHRRTQKQLSQEQLATRAGMTAGRVSALEAGRREPNLLEIFELAEALEMQPAQLVRATVQCE